MLPRILIVDDESSICISLSLALEPEYEVIWETDPIRALERLQTEPIDLVLLDMVIGPYDGLDILMKIKKLAPLAAVIMMTAYGSIRSSVSAMTRGAFTYLTKPLDLEELKIYIRQALEFRSLNENVTYLNDQLEAQNQAEELIGTSPALEQVRTMLRKFQNVDVNVLITGESGTGKRIAAHTLHNGADGRRFVTVNCAAFDEKRLEEEFFGYKMDAVPGALCDRRGKLDYANGGTLYLDGIGDMPPEFQRKLLRVLQEHTFSPIGSREVHQFHTRIIASANRTSDELVQSGLLRQDLLYRLNAVEIHMPRLRERRADILLLCSHFISRSSTLRNKRVRIRGVTDEALEILCAHTFPGNVRELANTIEYAGIVASGEWIRPKDLPYQFTNARPGLGEVERVLAGKTLQELERLAIETSYRANAGKRSAMVSELGISPRGLWNKLKEYGLQ